MSERMECPTCGYKCTPQWLNDQAHCLKCQTVLRRRPRGAGVGAGTAVTDFERRAPGETSTYKSAASTAREFEGEGGCSKSPNGNHLYRFGKCSHCAKAEPKLGVRPTSSNQRPLSPNPRTPSRTSSPMPRSASPPSPLPKEAPAAEKTCSKCNKPYSGHGAVCGGCRGFTKNGGSSKQCGSCGGFFWGFGEFCEDCTGGGNDDSPRKKVERNERTKVECPFCGYRCVPQWLNDKAHCLKCQAILKTQETVHGAALKVRPAQRQAGEVSTFKYAAGSAMESESGTCSKSPTGAHHWKFGKCEHCSKAEGKLVKGAGALPNPGGAGGCGAGGKCIYKFAKCTKCGKREY